MFAVRAISGIAVLAASFYGTLFVMDSNSDNTGLLAIGTESRKPCGGPRVVLSRPFGTDKGFAVIADLPKFRDFADGSEFPSYSKLILCEDNNQLGPPHSLHDDIRVKGLGRYSHWQDYVIFSTSDNSNPQTNERAYSVQLPR